MTNEQFVEVKEAVHQEYTLDEVYWKIVNMDWSQEMFRFFVDEISKKRHPTKEEALAQYERLKANSKRNKNENQ